jgi:hypothetical protein
MTNGEYSSHYALSKPPFGKEIPADELLNLPSMEHDLAAARLLVETRGTGVSTGKAGTGNPDYKSAGIYRGGPRASWASPTSVRRVNDKAAVH